MSSPKRSPRDAQVSPSTGTCSALSAISLARQAGEPSRSCRRFDVMKGGGVGLFFWIICHRDCGGVRERPRNGRSKKKIVVTWPGYSVRNIKKISWKKIWALAWVEKVASLFPTWVTPSALFDPVQAAGGPSQVGRLITKSPQPSPNPLPVVQKSWAKKSSLENSSGLNPLKSCIFTA